MEKVFSIYADRKGVSVGSLLFDIDGVAVSPTDTPVGLGLDDRDTIDCAHIESTEERREQKERLRDERRRRAQRREEKEARRAADDTAGG